MEMQLIKIKTSSLMHQSIKLLKWSKKLKNNNNLKKNKNENEFEIDCKKLSSGKVSLAIEK